MMSLWCLFRSPLFFGGELTDCDPWTLGLLTNEAVLTVHREGQNPRPLGLGGDTRVWRSDVGGRVVVGLFNLSDEPKVVATPGLTIVPGTLATDLWTGKALHPSEWGQPLPAHGCRLVQLGR
jgi:hypothetical protein